MKLYLKILLFISLIVTGCGNNETEVKPTNSEKEIPSFLFVAKYEGLPSIFKYNPKSDSTEVVWFSRNEKVIELLVPDNEATAFFLTATSAGKDGLFPYINNLKLYSLDKNHKPLLLKNFGNVLMAIAGLTSESTLKITTNSIDRTAVIYIDQNEKIFNEFGKILSDKTTRFNLAKDGFPRTTLKTLTLSSANRNLSVALSDSTRKVIDVKYAKEKIFRFSSPQELNSIKWFEQDSLLLFSTLDISPANNSLDSKSPETSALYIFSYKDKKIIKEWKGSGLRNFRVVDEFVIFDDDFGSNSVIKVINLKTFNERKVISHKGGCGLKNIPAKPDYDA